MHPLPCPAPLPARSRRRFASLRVIGALILREMSTSYGRSAGGYLWAVLEPAAGIALLTLVFALGFKSPPLGTNFPLFYATGIVPFLMYLDISGKLGTAVMFSKPLLAYPAVRYLDALVARFLLNAVTQLMVGCMLFFGLLWVFETRTVLDPGRIALAFAMTLALAAGVGTLNCFLMSRFPLWQRIWAILNRPLFIISCIFFTFEAAPAELRSILWWLPTIHPIGVMRAGFYPGYEASYASPFYIFSLSLGMVLLGLACLQRSHRDLIHG
ncbi:MAG: ABC transporter permease [Dinoroseobacter sp.]|nr:ABC transporter permease [Dinoroseobacter sp.]